MSDISSLITKNIESLSPEMQLTDALNVLHKYKFPGAPVINSNLEVVGVLSKNDMFIRDTGVHLPTLLKLLSEFQMYKADYSSLKEKLSTILAMKVKDAMNSKPIVIKPETSIEEAAEIFSLYYDMDPIPVVNKYGKFEGVVKQQDLMKLYGKEGPKLSYEPVSKRTLDDVINKFINSFENQFMFVSKFRIRFWMLTGLISLILGFIVATISIIDVNFS